MSQERAAGSRLLGLAMAALLAVAMAVSVSAVPSKAYAADDSAVRAAANGVMKFNWSIDGDNYSRGSCFLINENTVLTGYHCTMFSSNELERYGYSGTSLQDLRDRMTYSVTINRDVKVGATLVNSSEEQDFAIFKLDQPINGYTPLAIRDSSTVEPAETVYSVGFPGNNDLTVINTYTPSDVTFKRGTVNKAENIYQGMTRESFAINGYFIQTDCPISGGDSGGPMLDADGNVIGISIMGDEANGFYYAVACDKVTSVLDTLGVKWTAAPTPTPTPGPKPGPTYELLKTSLSNAIKDANSRNDSSKYTPESFAALTSALNAANDVRDLKLEDNTSEAEYKDKQGQIDAATKDLEEAIKQLKEPEPGPNVALIAGIIAAVVVIIAVVIVLVIRNRKKKAEAKSASDQPLISVSGAKPVESPSKVTWQAPPASNSTTVLTDDSNATTVLTEDSSDTILLFQSANGGSLTRMSNNDVIPINSAEFTIGRERSAVDYCIEDDSVTRVHARFVVHDGKTYVVDNKSSNGTTVNNVKCRPGQEVPLKNGDIITISKEKFRYNN